MVNCVNCGIEISSSQDSNFRGLCPECVRSQPLQKAAKNYNISRYVNVIGYIIGGIILLIIFAVFFG